MYETTIRKICSEYCVISAISNVASYQSLNIIVVNFMLLQTKWEH